MDVFDTLRICKFLFSLSNVWLLLWFQVVLSACSTYFDQIFTQYEERNPIVILKDVKYDDIKALVEFMYRGEINIEQVSV